MKLKKILAGAMAGAMVLGSVTGVSAETVTVTNATWWDAWTQTFEIKNGATLEFDVDLTTAGDYQWSSLNAVFVNDATDGTTAPAESSSNYYENAVLRSDNAYWGTGIDEGVATVTYTGTDYLYMGDSIALEGGTIDYKTLLTGAHYDITITRDDQTISYDYVITLSDNTVLNCGYDIVISVYDDNDIAYVFFTGDAGVTFTVTYGVEINSTVDTIGLVVDDTYTLDVTYVPDSLSSAVTFSSSDEKVATVDSTGKITAIAEGTAVITATSGSYSDSINVNVSASANLITGVTATASSSDLTVGGTATITPAYVAADTSIATTENNYSYSYAVTSGTDVISVDASTGVVTALAAGKGTVTVTVTCTNGTYTETVDFTVTEAATTTTTTEATSETTSSSTTDTEEETKEAVYTLVNEYDLDDTTIETWWETESFTSGIALEESHQYVITGTTTSASTNAWNNVLYVLYSSDDGEIYTLDETADNYEAGVAANYAEYVIARADNYAWNSTGNTYEGTLAGGATYTLVSAPDDWTEWLAATQEGMDFTITATYIDDTIQVELVCGEVDYIITYTVEDDSLTYYIALGGEACSLSNLHVADYEVSGVVLTTGTEETETTETDTDTEDSTTTVTVSESTSSSGDSTPPTGDASPIIPIAVAMIGCAAVVIAGKKRIA